jgi:hypothetical protein
MLDKPPVLPDFVLLVLVSFPALESAWDRNGIDLFWRELLLELVNDVWEFVEAGFVF